MWIRGGEFIQFLALASTSSFGSYVAVAGAAIGSGLVKYFGQKLLESCDDGNIYYSKQDKLLTKREIDRLKKGGEDIHSLKGGKHASRRDLYKDKNGNIVIKPKGGNGIGEPTGLNIDDF